MICFLSQSLVVLVCWIAASGGWAADSNTSCRVVLGLTDGSRVVGTPGIRPLLVQTDFAKVDASVLTSSG